MSLTYEQLLDEVVELENDDDISVQSLHHDTMKIIRKVYSMHKSYWSTKIF